ncbi:hypothetical protein TPHA_0G03110 [Tetrapisispora phaffii CBS 4417]|uniref:Anaphase-promoting complex subunit 4-like WD40 domain-containing protein n=1 Tax=Tetrapisispora phaffii (strain ATCC 24235 / CBS 4417 / NBRC 1672 / NRRL Y-8282 / UCD 70-5) TaxID=1071381 RepID=G8BW74_TETPH|nr:hypothetical protein TPHA_0G03110 [Tetrapisispora phaffii CBS 4417]CCE64152.1 hypothetical protein TPHA_0G03110 [Tetrapisispora phaffii CBS 4417]
MSLSLQSVIAPLPATERNFTTHLSYDEATNSIAYPCGKSAFVRSFDDDSVVQFTGHTSANVTVVKFSPIKNSQYLCSGDSSGKVIVWGWSRDPETKLVDINIKSEFQVLAGPVTDISWDFEGKRLCIVGEGRDSFGAFLSWDSGNSLGELSGHSKRINACHFKQSRPMRCITVGDDSSVVFFQGPPFKFSSSDRTHHDQGKFIRDVQFSPNSGDFAVTVGSDRKICCFDGKTGEFIKYIEDPNEEITAGIFALSFVDETKFVTASADAVIRLYDINESKVLQKWSLPEKSVANQLVGVVTAKGGQIIALSLDGKLNIFKIGESDAIRTIKGHNKGITALAVNPLISGSYDGRVIEWSDDNSKIKQNDEHNNLVVSIDNSDATQIATVSWDDTLRVNATVKHNFASQPMVATSDDKNSVTAVITADDILYVVNSQSGEIVQEKQLADTATAVGLTGSLVAVGYEKSREIEVFKSSDLNESYKLTQPLQATPSCLSISPSGSYLAAGDVMGKIVLYELSTKSVKTSRWSFHTSQITSIEWRPTDEDDEDYVVTGSTDTNIIIYSVKRTMKTIKYLNAHKGGVTCVKWKDGETVVSAGTDACIKQWSVDFS